MTDTEVTSAAQFIIIAMLAIVIHNMQPSIIWVIIAAVSAFAGLLIMLNRFIDRADTDEEVSL